MTAEPKKVPNEETVLLPPNCQYVSKRKHDCKFDRSHEDNKRLRKRVKHKQCTAHDSMSLNSLPEPNKYVKTILS